MRIGFSSLSLSKLEQVQPKKGHLSGFFTGFFFTLLLQSSSVSIALLVSFFSRHFIGLTFAIFYILAANVATTVTTQLFVWNNEILMLVCLLLGVILMFIKISRFFFFGCIIFGIGIIFTSLNGLENLSKPLSIYINAHFQNGVQDANFSLSMFGLFVTAIIQSSTALTGFLMSFIETGQITVLSVYYILLGANIGTCLTVLIVAIAHPVKTRIIAYTHIWINIIGGIIFFHPQIGQAIVDLSTMVSGDPKQQIVIVAFLYNVFASILFVCFIKPFRLFLNTLHRAPKTE